MWQTFEGVRGDKIRLWVPEKPMSSGERRRRRVALQIQKSEKEKMRGDGRATAWWAYRGKRHP